MTIWPKLSFVVGLPFSLLVFPFFCSPVVRAQTDVFIYPAKGQNQAQQDKDRYECHSWAVQQTGFDPSKPQSANSQSASQRPSSSPLPCYKEQLAEPRSERLAVRLRVMPARVPLPERQWEGLLAGSAVGTKKCDKLTLELMRRRRPVLGDRHICAQCRPVCRGAAIPLIDA